MDRDRLQRSREWIRAELDRCVRFWLENGMDAQHGGIYTCLDRKGEVYSTDKSVWMQGRAGWMFAYLCHVYGVRDEWLAASKSCIDFLEEHCISHAPSGRLYFTVTAEGAPLRQRRYCFSEAFYAMSNAEYYGVTGDTEHLQRARRGYELFWGLLHGAQDPLTFPPKTDPETRPGRSFGAPMICLNVTLVLMRVDAERAELYRRRARECVDEIFNYCVHPELKCVLESVAPDGSPRLYYTDGRAVNPGHDMECIWMLVEYARRSGDSALISRAEEIFSWADEAGWDKEYGGLMCMVDALGKPMEAFEHDMKLWWGHNEMLISALALYCATGKESYLERFYAVLDYCRQHFADDEYGEWYGYLRRDGKPTEPPTKGTTFKGPFHLPRMLVMTNLMLTRLLDAPNKAD